VASKNKPIRILIAVEGGVVQDVIADQPGASVCLKDWDNIKAQEPGRPWCPSWSPIRRFTRKNIERAAVVGIKKYEFPAEMSHPSEIKSRAVRGFKENI
jgi:hypothetical protein